MPAAKYIGEPGVVRVGDAPVAPGETIEGPPELVAELLTRADFVEAQSLETANVAQAPAAGGEED